MILKFQNHNYFFFQITNMQVQIKFFLCFHYFGFDPSVVGQCNRVCDWLIPGFV